MASRPGAVTVLRATRIVLLGLAALLLAGLPQAAAHERSGRPARGVVERPVAFSVVNQNRSATAPWCQGDGRTYTVRGSLVGPAGVEAGQIDAVTLYLHGGGDAATWHFTAAPRVDHITEMARLGHASVFLHLLGFGPSDAVDGNAVCFGTYADHTAQVIDQLRDASYTMAGGPAPEFERVALAGHSAGGLVAELAAVSFGSADALIVAGWTDAGLALGRSDSVGPPGPAFYYLAVAGTAHRCLTAPESKQPDGPGGWAFLFTTRAEFEMLVHDIDPRVLGGFVADFEQDPCGYAADIAAAVAASNALTPNVRVPVLLPNGDHDPFAPAAAVQAQRRRYALGGTDVTSLTIPDTGHMLMLERRAPVLREALSSWLGTRAF